MPIVDSLLKLVAVRGAEGLVIQSGEVPSLIKSDACVPLTMPVPAPDVIGTILGEVADDAQRALLAAGGHTRSRYRSDDVDWEVHIAPIDQGCRMTFRQGRLEPPQVTAPSAARPVAATTPYREGGDLMRLLDRAAAMKASDVLLSSNASPRVRVGGALQPLDGSAHDVEALLELVAPAMSDEDRRDFEASGSCDVAFVSDSGRRYRVNLFKQDRGVAVALRPISSDVPTLDALHLPRDFQQLTSHRSGLVLLVGTAGSGKSTTLVALIEHLNRTADKHVITLEDPIEYIYQPDRCLIHQREVGRHVVDFSSGLRAALRESPDVILVGEMRDRETIAAALTAAETGHLVLSTLHSASAAMAIDRIVDVFPEHQQAQVRYQVANVLRAVVTQILLPSTQPPKRVPAFEKLEVTSAVSTKIRENRCHQMETELQRGRADGMVPLELSLARLVQRKLLSHDLARRTAADSLLFEQLVVQSGGAGITLPT